jgi:predicted aspartyl protease
MSKLLATGAIAALLVASQTALGDSANLGGAPDLCKQVRITEVDLVTQPDGLVAVPAEIDDKPILLAVDTGAIHTVISSRVADDLKLPRDMSNDVYETVGGLPVYRMAYSHSFKLGTMATGRVGLLVAAPSAFPIDTDGVFGPDGMKNYDVEIDYARNKFSLFSQDHCPGRVVYWTHTPYAQVPMHVDKDSHVTVPLHLDGKPLTALIDTGAERSFMTQSVARDVFGIGPDKLVKSADVSLNGTAPTTVYHYAFTALALEGISVRNPDIDILPDSSVGRGGPQMVIGASVLRQLHLYLAYREQMLYATPAEAQ